MSGGQAFESLLTAMQESILKAHKLIETQHLNVLAHYFDEENKPLMMDLQFPVIDAEADEVVYKRVQVPKLSLVPMHTLKMKEMKLSFKVKLSGFAEANKSNGLFAHILPSNNNPSNDNFVDVDLYFETSDPPEAVMRINDQFIKVLP